jgi:hypothetical protein
MFTKVGDTLLSWELRTSRVGELFDHHKKRIKGALSTAKEKLDQLKALDFH